MAAHPFPRLVDERGTALVQVAAALGVFTVLSAFVLNVGLQQVGRLEIQTTADAAALAGATALAYDSYTDRGPDGPAVSVARAVAAENLVRSGEADVEATDVQFPVCASTYDAAASGSPKLGCVQVTAYRSSERANAIPALFGSLLGVTSYGVRATAVAEAKDANTTGCLRPIAVPDRWTERYPVNAPNSWSSSSTFDRYDPNNPTVLLPASTRDIYTAPDQIAAGTGMRMTGTVDNQVWLGERITLTPGSLATPISTISPWQYLPVQVPGSVWGANALRDNTLSCARANVGVGSTLDLVGGSITSNAAIVADAMSDLIALDPEATWDTTAGRVVNSCADVLVGRCASMSPRIVAIALYDPQRLADDSQLALPTRVRVRNIVGLFIEQVSGSQVTGRPVPHPGVIDPNVITLFDASSFLRATLLVQ